MYRNRITTLASVAAMCLLTGLLAYGAGGREVEVKGMIISRTGDTLTVRSPQGKFTVVLTDETRTKDNKGLFGMHKEYMANTVLIPGLKAQIKGVNDAHDRIVARTITVDGDDLETAEMIQAGLHPTAEQVAANERAMAVNQQATEANKQQIQQSMQDIQENTDRFSRLDDYHVKANQTVNFDVGSAALSSEAKQELKRLAQTAIGTPGYILEVKGFADASGDAAMNEKLSEDRADAVVGFLVQQCKVPVRHIVAPGAMGEYQPSATNETPQGRAENRRVEVAVLVNKGVSGQ